MYIYIYVCVCVCVCVYIIYSLLMKKHSFYTTDIFQYILICGQCA